MVDFVGINKQAYMLCCVFFSHVHVSIVMGKFRFRTLIRFKRMEASRICFVCVYVSILCVWKYFDRNQKKWVIGKLRLLDVYT